MSESTLDTIQLSLVMLSRGLILGTLAYLAAFMVGYYHARLVLCCLLGSLKSSETVLEVEEVVKAAHQQILCGPPGTREAIATPIGKAITAKLISLMPIPDLYRSAYERILRGLERLGRPQLDSESF